MSSLQEYFRLNIYYEILYLILVWRELESIKLGKIFCYCPPPTNLEYKMIHSCNFLTFSQNKLKVWKFQSISRLGSFQQLRKLREEGGGKFILFLFLFLTVHISSKYKLKFHRILLLKLSVCFLLLLYRFSSNLQFYCVFFCFFFFNFWL